MFIKSVKFKRQKNMINILSVLLILTVGSATINAAPASSSHDVRLVNGEGYYGQVEVRINGTWKSACVYGINYKLTAELICKNLGYKSAKDEYFRPNTSIDASTSIHMRCKGNETHLDECYDSSVACAVNYHDGSISEKERWHLGVICDSGKALPNDKTRLRGGSSQREGFAEIQVQGVWLGLCAYGFDILHADVFCRTLGYNGALGRQLISNLSKRPIWTKELSCKGDERSVSECQKNVPVERCSPRKVHIKCHSYPDPQVRLIGGSSPHYGEVEIKFNGTWGSVCSLGRSPHGICRLLNYSGGSAIINKFKSTTPLKKKWLEYLYCPDDASSITQCRHGDWGEIEYRYYCKSGLVAGVICDSPTAPASSSHDVRLVNGKGYYGQVEVRINGIWKSACLDGVNYKLTAELICKNLGYKTAKGEYFRPNTSIDASTSMHMRCKGKETHLNECYDNSACYVNHDGSISHLGVICDSGKALPNEKTRLRGGSSQREGIAEIQVHGVWLGLCSHSFDHIQADVFCRTLGYNGALGMQSISSLSKIWTKDLSCKGDERSVSQCQKILPLEWCGNSKVHIKCHSYQDPQVRLIGGSSPHYGEVEIKFNGTWGSVCSLGWSPHGICRLLNYSGGLVVLKKFKSTTPLKKKWLEDLYCPDDASSITQCHHGDWGEITYRDDCKSGLVAGVICHGPTVNNLTKLPVDIRLVGGIVPNKGRVQVRYKGVWGALSAPQSLYEMKNGRVCIYRYNNIHKVVCRMLGYRKARSLEYVNDSSTGPLLLTHAHCQGHEISIEECSHYSWGSARDYDSKEIIVECAHKI